MSYILEGGCISESIGGVIGVIKGDIRSLDCSSFGVWVLGI